MAQPIVNPTFSVNKPFDYEAEKDAVLRRQKYAEMLGQSALQPIEAGSYNGIQAPISPVQGLAKILEGAGAGYLEDQAAEGKRELETNARTEVGNWLASINEPQQLVEGAGAGDPGGGEAPYEDRGKSEERLRMAKIVRGLTSGNPYTTNIATMMYGENLKSKQGDLAHERAKELARMKAKHGDGSPRLGNTPVWGVKKDGTPVVMQISNAGGPMVVAESPPDVTPERGGARMVDLGDRIAVFDASGNLIGYQTKNLPPEAQPEIKGRQAGAAAGAAQAVAQSGLAFEELGKVNANIENYNIAIKLIDDGGNVTGPIQKLLPSFSSAAVRLDNIRNRLGLDIIKVVTFGALSEGELKLALDTALPTGLNPADLRAWLVAKQTAQTKLSKHLGDAAVFLGRDGSSIAKWMEQGAGRRTGVGGTPNPETAAPSGQGATTPAGRKKPPLGAVTKVSG